MGKKLLLPDWESVFERFSIMTVDGGLSDGQAFKYCAENSREEDSARLGEWIDSRNKKAAAEKADIETLRQYIEHGISLFPCECDGMTGKTRPICVLNDADGVPIEENRISDTDRLIEFMLGGGTLMSRERKPWRNIKPISSFGFIPMTRGYFCVDIDGGAKVGGGTHGTGGDGTAEFIALADVVDMTAYQKSLFADFPKRFPCYVATPSGGIHLYFRCRSLPDGWQLSNNIIYGGAARNIEQKYNRQITAAGSVKRSVRYVLHGGLSAAPEIPLGLLNAFAKPRQERRREEIRLRRTDDYSNITPEFCAEHGKKHKDGCGHDEMFSGVVGSFRYWYERTGKRELNAEGCMRHILNDPDYISWQDSDKEAQVSAAINYYYRRRKNGS